jgi:hypothetical protein
MIAGLRNNPNKVPETSKSARSAYVVVITRGGGNTRDIVPRYQIFPEGGGPKEIFVPRAQYTAYSRHRV